MRRAPGRGVAQLPVTALTTALLAGCTSCVSGQGGVDYSPVVRDERANLNMAADFIGSLP